MIILVYVTIGERLGRGIVTDAITTPVVNTSAYHFKNTAELLDFKVPFMSLIKSVALLIYYVYVGVSWNI